MSESVFILGAGASAKAGAPLLNDFLDVARRLERDPSQQISDEQGRAFRLVFEGIAELGTVYEKARLDSDNLEAVFAAFEMAKLFKRLGRLTPDQLQNLPDAMRTVIVETLERTVRFPLVGSLESSTVSAPEPYEPFVNLFRRDTPHADRVAVITFNYDLAIDYALHRAGFHIDYGLQPLPHLNQFPLLKLHGSLNWLECEQCGVAAYRMDNYFRRYQFDPWRATQWFRFAMTGPLQNDTFEHCNGNLKDPRVPMLVPPTWNKGEHHQRIASVWAHAARHLSEARKVAIIGYSLPESDYFFRLLWALGTVGPTRIEHLWVVNPDIEKDKRLNRRYRSLFGDVAKKRYKPMPCTFEEALESFGTTFLPS